MSRLIARPYLETMNKLQIQETQEPRSVATANGVIPCWSCKGPVSNCALFCGVCDAVQQPGQMDHFTRLDVETTFDIDTKALDGRYFDLQRRLHPDRFATRTSRERALSQQQATSLNDAYETLRDDLKRADYLVGLKVSGSSPEGCNQITDPVVLMEAMERREALAEAETVEDIQAIMRETAEDAGECVAQLSAAFAEDDLEAASRLATRLKYLRKLAEETRVHKARLAGAT
jgi:molecular chaperone HscB